MSDVLRLFENEVQIAALSFMGLVYLLRLAWIFRFPSRRTRTFPAGRRASGVGYSLMNIAMPWAMESTRRKPGFYAQFVIFHLGIAAAIAATFIIPYAPGVFEIGAVVLLFQAVIGAAFLAGIIRLARRLANPVLRLVSSADDYVSLVLLILFLGAGVLAVPNRADGVEWPLIAFFGLTAFFLVYVPFSKICHYLYYPFTRYYLGRSLGHRGAVPARGRSLSGPGPERSPESRDQEAAR